MKHWPCSNLLCWPPSEKATCSMFKVMVWPDRQMNPQPSGWKASALPIELTDNMLHKIHNKEEDGLGLSDNMKDGTLGQLVQGVYIRLACVAIDKHFLFNDWFSLIGINGFKSLIFISHMHFIHNATRREYFFDFLLWINL